MIKIFQTQQTSLIHNSVETTYTEGSWKGLLLYDVVSIPTAQVTTAVHMPVTEITSAKNFFISDSDWQVCCFLLFFKEIASKILTFIHSF